MSLPTGSSSPPAAQSQPERTDNTATSTAVSTCQPSTATVTATAESPQVTAANATPNAEEEEDELELVSVTQPGLVRVTRRVDPLSGNLVPFLEAADPTDEQERLVVSLRARIFEILPQLMTIDGVDRSGFVFDFNLEAANDCVSLSSGEDSEGYMLLLLLTLIIAAVSRVSG